jgi:IS30 family transposase
VSNKYRRLCAENRKVIANMNQAGKTQGEIAQAVGFSQSAISKELSRNHGERGYRPAQVERLANERKSRKRTRPKVMVGLIKDEIEARLGIKHSPDQISKSPVHEGCRISILANGLNGVIRVPGNQSVATFINFVEVRDLPLFIEIQGPRPRHRPRPREGRLLIIDPATA